MSDDLITEEIDGVLYTDIVPKHRPYDIETEDILYGDELEDGMMVLITTDHRADHRADYGTVNRETLVTKNRWCMVTKYRMDERQVTFVGLYNDGRKSIRRCGDTTGWVVIKDTIPVHEPARTLDDDDTLGTGI